MNVDYGNAFGGVNLPQNPQSGGNGGGSNRPPVDYDKVNTAILQAHGGVGKQLRIGVITNIYDLGTQAQDEVTMPVTDKDYSKHEWRLEMKEDNSGQKDPTASLAKRKVKGVLQDVLLYTPPPVKQIAITIDLPEVMFDYSVYSGGEASIKPYRIILGKEGFIPKGKVELAGTYNLIAKPFKLSHTNVNRGIEGAKPHYAMAKISQIYKLADWVGVLGADENFHAQEVGKLIGKAVMVEVEVQQQKWQAKDGSGERSKLVVDAKLASKLGPRDVPFYESELKPKLTQDLFGFVRFDAENDEETLKKINAAVINTMKLSPEFESSVLKSQLEKLGKLGDSSAPVVNNSPQKASQVAYTPPPQESVTPVEHEVQAPVYNEQGIDLDDSIPF
ncbi:hypothetical protein 2018Mat167_0335 [Vibrio phage ICP1]|nr:hypothetical protein [Vibrio phage JSF17]AXY82160.1 hypothetical protein ICP12011A_065 [Vibrio phage ICP1_2011_A]QFR59125.1 hypothetical protein ICP12017FMathbaria_065 [Vibrio phage ICP1_2017_F_Mathbaria]QVV99281.1 hypothetical protein 2015DhaA_0315 [Vibrio phage ICP1]QVW04109.1 hypothetical protein 2017MatI_0335 [Vibrio phage ICP1]